MRRAKTNFLAETRSKDVESFVGQIDEEKQRIEALVRLLNKQKISNLCKEEKSNLQLANVWIVADSGRNGNSSRQREADRALQGVDNQENARIFPLSYTYMTNKTPSLTEFGHLY